MNKLFCLVGVLVFVICVQCGPSDEMEKLFDECGKEVGMTEIPHGPPDFKDQKVKCFHACAMKKLGNMVDGKVSLEKELESASKHIPNFDDAMKAKLIECANTANAESEECEVAGAMGKCIFEKIKSPHTL